MAYLYVFLGGGLGAVCRYGISSLLGNQNTGFPWATFSANVLSCILLGILISTLAQKSEDRMIYLLLATGFCGGFSTFSTFSAESFELMKSGQINTALLYIAGSVLVCLLCIFIGIKLSMFFVKTL